jgi:hypothetical protein
MCPILLLPVAALALQTAMVAALVAAVAALAACYQELQVFRPASFTQPRLVQAAQVAQVQEQQGLIVR